MAAGSAPLGFFDYVKKAFFWRSKVPLLGHLPLNVAALAAFGVLGLANPGFWLLGAGLELAYLVGVASNARFQKVVDGQGAEARHRNSEQRLFDAVQRLDRDHQQRFYGLLTQCREIAAISETLSQGSIASMTKMRTGGLNQMLWIFLRLLTSREVLLDSLETSQKQAVESEIESLEERLAAIDDNTSLARSLRSSLEIQQKRLQTLGRSQENLEVVEAELDRIESQVALLREEAAVSGRAEVLSDRLDSVTGALSETNRWMDQHSELFSGLEGLGTPELESLPDAAAAARVRGERTLMARTQGTLPAWAQEMRKPVSLRHVLAVRALRRSPRPRVAAGSKVNDHDWAGEE